MSQPIAYYRNRALPRPDRPRRSKRRQRRGILILVVLSMLFLFVLVAVSYVVVANSHRKVSKQFQRVEMTGDSAESEVEASLMALVRGELSPYSPFTNTSLLEDMYGHYGLRGVISGGGSQSVANGELIWVQFNVSPLNSRPGYYNGCVVTVIDAPNNLPLKGLSTRIVASEMTGAFLKAYLLPFRDQLGASVPVRGSEAILINSREFAGTGQGFNVATGVLDRQYNSVPVALLPNLAAINNGFDPSEIGGANESYDAPDFQNPFLAYYDLSNGQLNSSAQVKPSFHDPALLTYLSTKGNVSGSAISGAMFRPNPAVHTTFTGSNPAAPVGSFDISHSFWTNGPWDIDNDGDGIPDSIWIDPGFPVQVTKDGRLYKRLIAPLVIDMDGRVNINTAGSDEQTDPAYDGAVNGLPLAGGVASIQTPQRGEGFSPNEVNLKIALNGDSTQANNTFNGGGGLEGRFGEGTGGNKKAGVSTSTTSGWAMQMKLHTVPNDFFSVQSSYGSPPDVWGRLTNGIDFTGHLIYGYRSNTPPPANETIHPPLEINLGRDAGRGLTAGSRVDNPFSVGELERILRPTDFDNTMLPQRISKVLSGAFTGNPLVLNRNLFTTDSWDTPVTCPLPWPNERMEMLNDGANSNTNPPLVRHISETLQKRLSPPNSVQPNQYTQLIAPEILAGRRMNLNWPLGNGKDDDNNGIVDEIGEAVNEIWNFGAAPFGGGINNFSTQTSIRLALSQGVDLNRDNAANNQDNALVRQQIARYLYILMMLSADIPDYSNNSKIATSFNFNYVEDDVVNAPSNKDRIMHELTTRRLAQWAINVVDYMDFDNAMTPFEYDIQPWNGWNVDGVIADGVNNSQDDTQPFRRLVWGCEQPLVVLSETFSGHDRRVRDTDLDDDKGKKRDGNNDGDDDDAMEDDDTPDQALIPRGITIVELYAAFPGRQPVAANDVFMQDNTTQNWVLDLAKMTPAANGQQASPVWRLAFTKSFKANPSESPVARAKDHYDTVSFQTQQSKTDTAAQMEGTFSLLPLALQEQHDKPAIEIERLVWFTPTVPAGIDPLDRDISYCGVNTPAQVPLRGGQYLVLGPDGVGAGARTNGTTDGLAIGGVMNDIGDASEQRIKMRAAAPFNVTNVAGTRDPIYPPTGMTIDTVVTFPVASGSKPQPAGWGNADRVGFSISEPLFSAANYYPVPTDDNVETGLREAYGDPGGANKTFLDKPLDSEVGMPLKADDLIKAQTQLNYKTVFLQRLADPTKPWNRRSNPYLTVDFMPIDLTVFNGDDRPDPNAMLPANEWDPEDADAADPKNIIFVTRERGSKTPYTLGTTALQPTTTTFDLWHPITEDPKAADNDKAANANDTIFQYNLVHTLGYLNKTYGAPIPPAQLGQHSQYYLGSPMRPWPWLGWNNRPYNSPLELMRVPASHPSRLGWEFNFQAAALPNYNGGNVQLATGLNAQFGHLINFFHTDIVTPNPPPANPPRKTTGNFYRIFDWVTTPTRFNGTETWLKPDNVQNMASNPAVQGFQSPFNYVPQYREPGKININTVNSPRSWDAAKNNWQGPTFNELVESRKGVALNPGENQLTVQSNNPTYPSVFSNPFRSSNAAEMMPVAGAPLNLNMNRKGVNATLLRASGPDPDNTPTAAPLFGPRFAAQPAEYQDPNRHAVMGTQSLERWPNLVSTRSNVYAIWVTVGYFEVTPANVPGGYQIGQELGLDTGEVTRHRGFGVFDRSIPVGFERGQNHNVEKAFLIRKFLE